MKTTNILLATDFSKASQPAFDEACALAKEQGARLLIVHADHVTMFYAPDLLPVPADLIERSLESLEKELERLCAEARARGVATVEPLLLEGAAWDLIVEQARKEGSDLIVVGSHGRTGLRHALVGSVAEKVVRHAPCSVLVVRDAAAA